MGLFTGTLRVDLLLGDVHSLKSKRGIVRPIVAEIRRTFSVAVAETGRQDLYRRAELGVAVVAADAAHCVDVLDAVERLIAARPEIELLSTHRQLHNDEDEVTPVLEAEPRSDDGRSA